MVVVMNKKDTDTEIFRFDPGSSIKLLSSKIEKIVSPKYGAIYPRQAILSPVPI